MIDIEKTLEFDKIKEKLIMLAYTRKAKEKINALEPYMSENEVVARLRDTTEAKIMLEKGGNPPLTSMNGMDDLIEIAEKGGCLTSEQLESVAVSLTAVKRLKNYLDRCKQYELSVPYFEENLDSLEEIREEINSKIRGGNVDDFASKLLKSLRGDIESTELKMREKADGLLRANKESMSESFVIMRNGHICLPVKKECKSKIAGSLVDKSSTGNTLFIEPQAVAKYYEVIQNLRFDEENEVRRILYSLTAMLADKEDIMITNSHTIEKLDFIFAKGKLSLDYDGMEPKINSERRIKIKNGRHPLMDKTINVPLDFELGTLIDGNVIDGNIKNRTKKNESRISGIIITGPNTGGKTVAIKTVALNCMMAQCGLHVSCENADICMNNMILCDIGDGQNIAENLSTFSAHITNALHILRTADCDSLVVMDELGSGTDPTEGMGIAIAILEELKKSGALYLVTTHYPEVKNYAETTEGVVNARMTFDKESLKPLYQLVIGEAGESCAFYIAQKLGMPGTMLRRAIMASYGNEEAEDIDLKYGVEDIDLVHLKSKTLQKKKSTNSYNINYQVEAKKFRLGDSVMVLPDKKSGVVCEVANEKGVLRIQMPNKKVWINHKRVKLQVAATQLYPENYDFSIVFDTVENRKARHEMERKYVADLSIKYEE